MIDLSFTNLIVYSAQVLVVVAAAGAASWLFDAPAARVRYAHWRGVLGICLLLPLLGLVRATPAAATTTAADVSESLQTMAVADSMRAPAVSVTTLALWGYVAGIGFRLFSLALGFVQLRRLRLHSVPIAMDDELDALRRGLAAGAELKTHPTVRQPITFGLRRPLVLLPETFSELPLETQRVIACHELVHVRRRDWPWILLEEIVRSLFWFHPAMRWALNRLQLAREELVDEAVVDITGARRAYMTALVTFADSPALVPATLFIGRSHLATRIRRIAKEAPMSRLRLAFTGGALALILAASTWQISAAMPLRVEAADKSSPAAGAGPGNVRVTLADPRLLHPITQVHPQYPADLLKSGVGATIELMVTVSARGRVERIADSKWQLTVSESNQIDDLPGFWARKPWQPFVEAAESAVRQWTFQPGDSPMTTKMTVVFRSGGSVTMFAPAPPPPPPPPPPPAADAALDQARERLQRLAPPPPPPPPPPRANMNQDRALRVGGSIAAPTKTKDVRPVYPEAARAAGVQGVVILQIRIAGDGTVTDTEVVRSIPLLDDAAIEAVRQWLFTPTLLNGAPVDVIMMATINFTLEQ